MVRYTGKIDPARILSDTVPEAPEGIVARIRALGCDSSLMSDAMDDLGIAGTLPASRFAPTLPGHGIVGPATTVRNVVAPGDVSPHERARRKDNGMAEMEAHNLARAGDVLVIEGVEGLSNMGGISAQIAKREGVAGAVVLGGIRDVAHSREEGFPLWATEQHPLTGKWRIRTVEINGPVTLDGVHIRPGDLVVADDTGIAIVPRDRAEEVVTLAEAQHALEAVRIEAVRAGAHVADLPTKVPE